MLAGAPAGAGLLRKPKDILVGGGYLGKLGFKGSKGSKGMQPFQVALLFAVAIHTAKEQWLRIIPQKKKTFRQSGYCSTLEKYK